MTGEASKILGDTSYYYPTSMTQVHYTNPMLLFDLVEVDSNIEIVNNLARPYDIGHIR